MPRRRRLLSESSHSLEEDGPSCPDDKSDVIRGFIDETYLQSNLDLLTAVINESKPYWNESVEINTIKLNKTECDKMAEAGQYAWNIQTTLTCYEEYGVGCLEAFETQHVSGQYLVLYVSFVILVGCFFKWLPTKVKSFTFPYTVVLLLAGIIFECIEAFEPQWFGDLQIGLELVR